MRWCKSLTKDITRWLMTKNRVALSISLSLSRLTYSGIPRLILYIFRSRKAGLQWSLSSNTRAGLKTVVFLRAGLMSASTSWSQLTRCGDRTPLWGSEGGEAAKFSRLCEVPSRQSTLPLFSSFQNKGIFPPVPTKHDLQFRTGYIKLLSRPNNIFLHFTLKYPRKGFQVPTKNTPGWWV